MAIVVDSPYTITSSISAIPLKLLFRTLYNGKTLKRLCGKSAEAELVLSLPDQKQQLHRDNEDLMYGRKTDGGCVPLSLWTTLHDTLIPYPSDGLRCKYAKTLTATDLVFTNMTVLGN